MPLLPPLTWPPAPFEALALALELAELETNLILVGGPLGVGCGVPSVAAVDGAAEPSLVACPVAAEADESSSARRSAFSESSFSNWDLKNAC